jgi:hypothetical protein
MSFCVYGIRDGKESTYMGGELNRHAKVNGPGIGPTSRHI